MQVAVCLTAFNHDGLRRCQLPHTVRSSFRVRIQLDDDREIVVTKSDTDRRHLRVVTLHHALRHSIGGPFQVGPRSVGLSKPHLAPVRWQRPDSRSTLVQVGREHHDQAVPLHVHAAKARLGLGVLLDHLVIRPAACAWKSRSYSAISGRLS